MKGSQVKTNNAVLFACMCICLAFSLSGCYHNSVPDLPNPPADHDIGEQALRSQDYALAETKWSLPPAGPVATVSLSRIHAAQGRYRESILESEAFRDTLKDDVIGAALQNCEIGRLHLNLGRESAALECFRAAVQSLQAHHQRFPRPLDDGNPAVAPYLGQFYLEVGEYGQAIDSFQSRLDFFVAHPKESPPRGDFHGGTRVMLGGAYYHSGDLAKAEELLALATDTRRIDCAWTEDFAVAKSLLGRIRERTGRAQEALKDFQAAVQILRDEKPPFHRTQQADALSELAAFRLRRGDTAEAKQSYEQARDLREATATATHPNYADLLVGLADANLVMKDMGEATTLAQRALRVLDDCVVPTHPRTASALVAIYSLSVLSGGAGSPAPAPNEQVFDRLTTLMKKRMGLWEEPFRHEVKFHAAALSAAGHQAEADRLLSLNPVKNITDIPALPSQR